MLCKTNKQVKAPGPCLWLTNSRVGSVGVVTADLNRTLQFWIRRPTQLNGVVSACPYEHVLFCFILGTGSMHGMTALTHLWVPHSAGHIYGSDICNSSAQPDGVHQRSLIIAQTVLLLDPDGFR